MFVGGDATLSVVASGIPTPDFQWLFNGAPLAGATDSTLALYGADFTNAGIYQVVVTNMLGSVLSSKAVLTVVPVLTNDQCGSATVVAGPNYSDLESTTNATSTGDPASPSILSNGVWYVFTPATSGNVAVDTSGSTFDTVLAMYAGACGALSLVTYNDDAGGNLPLTSAFTNAVTAGTPYYFLAGGYYGAVGDLVFHLVFTANELPPPSISSGFGFTNGQFRFTLTGPAGSTAVIYASTNLRTWVPQATNPLVGGSLVFTDTQATNYPRRYYRARLQ